MSLGGKELILFCSSPGILRQPQYLARERQTFGYVAATTGVSHMRTRELLPRVCLCIKTLVSCIQFSCCCMILAMIVGEVLHYHRQL